MATIKARGQISVVDLNDAVQVQFRLNVGWRDQNYNPDTKVYDPDFSKTNNVITPLVIVTGIDEDCAKRLTSLSYNINGTEVAAGATSGIYSVAAISAGGALTIKGNITERSFRIKATATYHDDTTGLDTRLECQEWINKHVSSGALFQVLCTIEPLDYFGKSNKAGVIKAKAFCKRGGTPDKDGITYTWQRYDGANSRWEAVATSKVATAGGESTLTINEADVINIQSFKVIAQDGKDIAEEVFTIRDLSDPFSVELYGEGGTVFKNGQGEKKLFARLWQGDKLIEDESTPQKKYTYTWTKTDGKGAPQNFDGTTSNKKTGNPITIKATEINGTASFFCEVSA